MARQGRIGGAASVVAVLSAVAVVAATPGALAAEPRSYRIAEDAEAVNGRVSSADAPKITPGRYRDSIEPGEEKFYAVNLDSTSAAFLTATAAPRPGSAVKNYEDGITVGLESLDGRSCSGGEAEAVRDVAYPLTASAERLTDRDRPQKCQRKGPYLFSVERSKVAGSDSAAWPVEIAFMVEPGLEGGIPSPHPGTEEERDEEEGRPAPPTGKARRAEGGTGFNDAAATGKGVWKDRLAPGETGYYKVPVDWGQRLHATAELPGAPGVGEDDLAIYMSDAFRLSLFNTARGSVRGDEFSDYQGERAQTALYTNPVRYENRYAERNSDTRFAGWQYLAFTVNEKLAEFFPDGVPVTLRIDVRGDPKDGPDYAGDERAAGFGVDGDDRETAEKGRAERERQEAAQSDGLRALGLTGVGVGSALLLALGTWYLVGRLRPAPAPAAGPPPPRSGQTPAPSPAQPPPGPHTPPEHGVSQPRSETVQLGEQSGGRQPGRARPDQARPDQEWPEQGRHGGGPEHGPPPN